MANGNETMKDGAAAVLERPMGADRDLGLDFDQALAPVTPKDSAADAKPVFRATVSNVISSPVRKR